MLVDSWYDAYLGVVVLIRVIDGRIKKGDRIRMMATGGLYHVERLGVFRPKMENIDSLGPGEIGFLTASIKQVRDTRVGDTITTEKKGAETPLPGFKPAQPVVFCGLFPVDSAEFEDLRDAIDKLALNDASFSHEMETSAALGFGFRCGFLGLLHLEVIRDRLEREYEIELITTAPSVIYQIYDARREHDRAAQPRRHARPRDQSITIEEPRIKATILVPDEYLGDVLKLCQDRRGIQMDLTYAGTRAMVVYDLPLNEVVFDFYDRLKSVTKGYASFDYQMIGYREDFLVKMSVLVNDEPVDALSMMVHRDRAEMRGRAMVEKLKELIPRHMFKIPIQAAIGGQGDRPRDPVRDAQGRDREMLWRRRDPEAEAAGQAEGREKEDAAVRQGGYPARSLHKRPQDGQLKLSISGVYEAVGGSGFRRKPRAHPVELVRTDAPVATRQRRRRVPLGRRQRHQLGHRQRSFINHFNDLGLPRRVLRHNGQRHGSRYQSRNGEEDNQTYLHQRHHGHTGVLSFNYSMLSIARPPS